ncbi:MAG: type II toxin-antitoxin system RatA family toxin [Gammaproteobacteria bacterium]|nr:type II toxin-antitoxin system RatA family toxin [Gammaproteobacteria bacterium]
MVVIQRQALVPYTAAEMYALVDDVAAYPQFLPWCRSSRIAFRNEDEVEASIELARGSLHKTFTTRNRLQHGKMIEMRLVEGPFHHLQGCWRFEALGSDGCRVMLDLEYEFSNVLLKMTVGPVFNQIANTLVDAFSQRAVEIYGKR